MASIAETTIFCKGNCKFDFSGGNLSSDSGLLLVGEFMESIGMFGLLDRTFNEVGYHPQLCYDGNTGDLLRVSLRKGASYCGKDADLFLKPLLVLKNCESMRFFRKLGVISKIACF